MLTESLPVSFIKYITILPLKLKVDSSTPERYTQFDHSSSTVFTSIIQIPKAISGIESLELIDDVSGVSLDYKLSN